MNAIGPSIINKTTNRKRLIRFLKSAAFLSSSSENGLKDPKFSSRGFLL